MSNDKKEYTREPGDPAKQEEINRMGENNAPPRDEVVTFDPDDHLQNFLSDDKKVHVPEALDQLPHKEAAPELNVIPPKDIAAIERESIAGSDALLADDANLPEVVERKEKKEPAKRAPKSSSEQSAEVEPEDKEEVAENSNLTFHPMADKGKKSEEFPRS